MMKASTQALTKSSEQISTAAAFLMQGGSSRVNADPEVSVIVNDKKSLQPEDNKDYVAQQPVKKPS
jgi:hypothetical protein